MSGAHYWTPLKLSLIHIWIIEFLRDYKQRRQTAEYRKQRETPLNVRKEAVNPCRSVGEILKGMGATFRRESVFSAPDFPITAYKMCIRDRPSAVPAMIP